MTSCSISCSLSGYLGCRPESHSHLEYLTSGICPEQEPPISHINQRALGRRTQARSSPPPIPFLLFHPANPNRKDAQPASHHTPQPRKLEHPSPTTVFAATSNPPCICYQRLALPRSALLIHPVAQESSFDEAVAPRTNVCDSSRRRHTHTTIPAPTLNINVILPFHPYYYPTSLPRLRSAPETTAAIPSDSLFIPLPPSSPRFHPSRLALGPTSLRHRKNGHQHGGCWSRPRRRVAHQL